jgi:hypothetical protein
MTVKSFEEIKDILKKYKRASGVGFVILPQLLKIAIQVGLVGYWEAQQKWLESSIYGASVGAEGVEGREVKPRSIAISWEGPGLWRDNTGCIRVGIERTIQEIEMLLK